MEQRYKNVVIKTTATIRVEMQVPATTPEDAEKYIQNLAENNMYDLIDGKIKELDPEILWID